MRYCVRRPVTFVVALLTLALWLAIAFRRGDWQTRLGGGGDSRKRDDDRVATAA